jgi:hypothetical protein
MIAKVADLQFDVEVLQREETFPYPLDEFAYVRRWLRHPRLGRQHQAHDNPHMPEPITARFG